jgi:integrase
MAPRAGLEPATKRLTREVAEMSWSEVEFERRLWTVPAKRMKGDRAHEVPVAPAAVALLESLPRWNGGDFIFTTARVDRLSGVSAWVIHDLRRTVRTHLSALPVEDLVRELVIAHAKPGLHKVYDLHAYQDEKRRCLDLWEKRLLSIVEPRPCDVADLAESRESRKWAGNDRNL